MNNREENLNHNKESDKRRNLKEMWKDKKGRAKIELCLYGIFFIGVIIFARVLNTKEIELENKNPTNNSFLKDVTDNYEYNIEINIDDNIYMYQGTRIGYNATITRIVEEEKTEFSIINNKYYVNENGNYLLTTEKEVYPYISYRYLNIDNIKGFINMSEKVNSTYNLKLSNLLLEGDGEKYISFTLDEENTSLIIDYSELFKEINPTNSKVIVKYNLKNINKITSLDSNVGTNTK